MENQCSNNRSTMEQELIRGLDMANQLLEVLAHHDQSNTQDNIVKRLRSPFAEDLVHKILRSFTNTLSLLSTNNDDVSDKEEVVPLTITNFSSSSILPKNEDTNDESCKSYSNAKKRRGYYKRRSTAPTWERDSSILIEDGYALGKYGHKMIMNSKYPRSYYRCTHKCDQSCPAIKKVQRIQEDPPLYRTTYCGNHICKASLITDPETNLEPASSLGSAMFLSFNNNNFHSKEEYPFSSTLFASAKQEPMEVIPNIYDRINAGSIQLNSSDYLMLCDYELHCERHVTMLSSAESVQFDNIYGCSLDSDS